MQVFKILWQVLLKYSKANKQLSIVTLWVLAQGIVIVMPFQ